jgi:predicted AlkP superfamily phosphohydrolase/phosphomutase
MEGEVLAPLISGDILGGLRSLCEYTLKRKEAALYLLGKYDTEFMAVVFRGPEIIQRYGYRYMDAAQGDKQSADAGKYGELIFHYYEVLDGVITELIDAVGEAATTIIMSVYGGGPGKGILHLNRWLRDEGYLVVKPWPLSTTLRPAGRRIVMSGILRRLGLGALLRLLPARLAGMRLPVLRVRRDPMRRIDWSRTRAYGGVFASPASITINVSRHGAQDRRIEREEYDRLRADIARGLMSLRDAATGESVVSHVRMREDVYSGPMLEHAPDIFVETAGQAYHVSEWPFAPEIVTGPGEARLGLPRREGVLMMMGPAVEAGTQIDGARIVDLAPTILGLLGMEVPPDMDGRVLGGPMS